MTQEQPATCRFKHRTCPVHALRRCRPRNRRCLANSSNGPNQAHKLGRKARNSLAGNGFTEYLPRTELHFLQLPGGCRSNTQLPRKFKAGSFPDFLQGAKFPGDWNDVLKHTRLLQNWDAIVPTQQSCVWEPHMNFHRTRLTADFDRQLRLPHVRIPVIVTGDSGLS